MSNLFDVAVENESDHRPLADQLRPKTIETVVGQDDLLHGDGMIARMVRDGKIGSTILWGPPGCGKTTIARLLAGHTDLFFESISAIFSGVADLRKVFDTAKERRRMGQGTLLFVDEIHRFNKSQQDAFLPHVEDGTIVLVGATTENPSFELNAALLSRCQLAVLKRLGDEALEQLLQAAETHLSVKLPVDDEARQALKSMADGDGRYLLNLVEQLMTVPTDEELDTKNLAKWVQKRAPIYDKNNEEHYNLISALHKSVRGSDVNAALYWLARMLSGGEDPKYIARRVIRMAVEDIGLADPQALPQTLAAMETYERLGSPEGELAIAQAVIYCTTAPKSNAAYAAYKAAMSSAKETGSVMPPAHILNAPTQMMKDIGYGKGYAYDHNTEHGFSGQNYFPDDMPRQEFYVPVERGFEREIKKRLDYWQKLAQQLNENQELQGD